MIKLFSGQIVFLFSLRGAIMAYVGEIWLYQYTVSYLIHISLMAPE